MNSDHPLVAAVRASWRWTGGAVVAVSGGPDSVALLAALQEIRVDPLVIAHVNHQMRGAASDGDELFVRNLGARLGIPVESRSVEAAPQEAHARRLRYEQLQAIAATAGIATIATGHNRDDQIETVIFRLLRGSGLAGLAGIPPVRRAGALRIVRPLLNVARADVLDYLAASDLDYRKDASNIDRRYARNRIRHDILPQLLRFAPAGAAERLALVADEARDYQRYARSRARWLLADAELPPAPPWCVLDAEKLRGISVGALRLLWRMLWQREGWPTGAMTRRHWQRLAELCAAGEAAVDCTGGIRARRLPRVIRVGPDC